MHIRKAFVSANVAVLAVVVGVVLPSLGGGPQETAQERAPDRPVGERILDDFSTAAAKSSAAARWELAEGSGTGTKVAIEEYEGRTCLHVTEMTQRDKGSRVLVRRSLFSRRRPTDASAYQGIRLTAKGNGRTYAIHLKTRRTRFPGQCYRAEFQTNGQWQEITLPFRVFKAVSVTQPLDTAGLLSIAVVADGGKPKTDVYIDTIGFYRERSMYRKLTPEEERVIMHKGTERPFTGKYNDHFERGVYTCRRCGAELFESSDKFRSHCGWPSFDDQIPGAVRQQRDADGVRIEILCNRCGGHLGHIFLGENLTPKNARYCVNSISMDFLSAEQRRAQAEAKPTEAGRPNVARALFASGCFWGTEYHLQRAAGAISTTVGYTGGHVENPTYKQVCTGRTGHAETTEVLYDPTKTTYEQLARLFFETHDFTQLNRQGPDIGTQYRSAVFYLNEQQKKTAEELIQTLRRKGFNVKTEVTPAGKFWPAENYHQDYYNNNGKTPYCHIYRKIF